MLRNSRKTSAGKVRAICNYCGREGRPTEPNADGEPDLWMMGAGWSEAPFPANHTHDDGSIGSSYTCPACNSKLRSGQVLRTRGGQLARMVS